MIIIISIYSTVLVTSCVHFGDFGGSFFFFVLFVLFCFVLFCHYIIVSLFSTGFYRTCLYPYQITGFRIVHTRTIIFPKLCTGKSSLIIVYNAKNQVLRNLWNLQIAHNIIRNVGMVRLTNINVKSKYQITAKSNGNMQIFPNRKTHLAVVKATTVSIWDMTTILTVVGVVVVLGWWWLWWCTVGKNQFKVCLKSKWMMWQFLLLLWGRKHPK